MVIEYTWTILKLVCIYIYSHYIWYYMDMDQYSRPRGPPIFIMLLVLTIYHLLGVSNFMARLDTRPVTPQVSNV